MISALSDILALNSWVKIGEVLPITTASEFVPGAAGAGLQIPVRRKLLVLADITGSSGAAISRLRVGTLGIPDTTVGNYGAKAMEDNAAPVTNLGAVAGINTASVADTDRRGVAFFILNNPGRVKRFMGFGMHSAADATGTAVTLFLGGGIYTITGQAPINCIQLWSGVAGVTLAIGTHFQVWGAD